MSRIEVIEETIDTSFVQLGACKEVAKVILGEDHLWTTRVIRVSHPPKGAPCSMGGYEIPKGRVARVVISRTPWRVIRPTTRPSSLGRFLCTPPFAVCKEF